MLDALLVQDAVGAGVELNAGFTVDEPAASLGQALKLPGFLEPRRAEIEAKLPALDVETV